MGQRASQGCEGNNVCCIPKSHPNLRIVPCTARRTAAQATSLGSRIGVELANEGFKCSFAMAAPFLLEQQVAIAAVRRACSLTTTVFNKLVVGETLVKGDKSPVTGARVTMGPS
jgi:hypothetical protein